MSDHTELKRAASAAKNWGGEIGEHRWYLAECFKRPYFSVPDAEFIAACDPGMVLALIAENDSQRKDLQNLRSDNAKLTYALKQQEQSYLVLRADRDRLKAENEALNTAIEDLERGRVAGFEEYDFTRLKDRRGDQKVFEITIETECGCDVEEGEYTVRITHLLGNWLGSDDFGLIADAVAEVVADLGLPEEGYTTFIAYESGERQDVYWTKWFEIATVASVLAEPGAAMSNGEQS